MANPKMIIFRIWLKFPIKSLHLQLIIHHVALVLLNSPPIIHLYPYEGYAPACIKH